MIDIAARELLTTAQRPGGFAARLDRQRRPRESL
jgi:hypothetical protein